MSHQGWVKERFIRDGAVTEDKLGAGAITETKIGGNAVQVRKFLYDFAVGGGAVGAITLTDEDGEAQTLPANALIKSVHYHVITAPTSGGLATVALGITGNDNAFKVLTAFDDATYALDYVAAGNAEVPLLVGASAVSVLLTVAVAALTAGKAEIWVEYVQAV